MPASDVNYLSGSQVRILNVEGALYPRVEIIGDRCILAAQFKRVFPLSEPQRFISIQDLESREVAILENLDGMAEEQRKIVLGELDRRYFTPVVTTIDDLKQDAGMWKFSVQTQRGPAQFYVRNWRDSAHEAAHGRWQILSVDGQRFEIQQVDELDHRSQELLEQLL